MFTGQSAPIESLAEIEQRIRDENQQALADMRDQLRAEWAAEL
ncbi:hypothetical protein A2U01_0113912, partial [Trifolium medium]|nr:hypothetical protein [Trifolium medium]